MMLPSHAQAQRHIVAYSMGICSAYIAVRWQEDGKNPICLWSDTKREDDDTYRFAREVADRWNLNIVEASDGRDLWDVFRQQKMIPARQVPMCSIRMKIKPAQEWFTANDDKPGLVAYGYDMDEEDRAARTLARWPYRNLRPVFPLLDWGVSKAQCFGLFNERGIQPPRMYRHFRHANCLPCKNFRRNDWNALLKHYPEKFEEAARFEEETGLRWMQDGPLLRVVEEERKDAKRRKLPMAEPAFSFDMGCDACAKD